MKVHAKHEKIQEFLKENPLDGVHIVDDPFQAHYVITGRYKQTDYHDNLKGIIIPYTGHNGIDLKSMKDKNLMLFVTPTRSRYVAEKAVALTLALTGRVLAYDSMLRQGNWAERNSDSRLPWTSIQDKTIGLFGFGRIGKRIYEMLQGFHCDFAVIDRGKDYPSNVMTVKNLTNLVQFSDIIIVSTPLNQETENIIDEPILSRMKRKYLINVGRGKVIDEKALYDSLKTNHLKGYASDVWYQYPKEKEACYPSLYPFHELDNVILSNHSGGYTNNTNDEVNKDILKTLEKLQKENFEDQLDLEGLL
jgi:formate dehydrogenase